MKQWDTLWGLYRRRIVFAQSEDALDAGVEELLKNAALLSKNGEAEYASELVENILVDIQSYLTIWKLDECVSAAGKETAIKKMRAFLEAVGANEALQRADEEVKSIAASQFGRMAKATKAGELFTFWGNDLCTGVDFSLRRGASYTTSNPSKINLFRQAEPEKYQALLREVMEAEPGLSRHEIISRLTVKVVSLVARKLLPIYEATNGQFGVSFTQISPFAWNDAAEMEHEVLAWRKAFAKELGSDRPNVVFKMPATPAAKEAAKSLLQQEGMRLTMTSNFAAGQHAPFYEVLDGHEPNCFLVIVDCHLRKFARPEFEALGVDADYYCERLVHAVVQRCYQTLLARGSNIMINGAGMREDVGIRLCLTKNAELPMTLTVTPTLAETFDSAPRSLEPIWNEPISAKDMEVLNKSKIFRQAYYPEEFPWQDVRSFPPFAFMMDGFEEAYNACMEAIPEQ